jgi:hypothetical protein
MRKEMESSYTPAYSFDYVESDTEESVLLAFLTGKESAQAAVRELRELGIHAQDISVLSRDREPPDDPALPATEPDVVPDQMPIVTDYEVPPDEPLGGSDRLGIPRKDERGEDVKRDA